MAEIAARTAAAEPAAVNPSGVRAPIPTIETGYRDAKLAAVKKGLAALLPKENVAGVAAKK